MQDRVKASHEMALVMLGQTPAQFWRSTPSDTANLITAHRRRTNDRLMRRAWEIYTIVSPHLSEHSDLTPLKLFDSMPGTFASDIPEAARASDGMPTGLSPGQQAEWTRRRNRKRVLRQSPASRATLDSFITSNP